MISAKQSIVVTHHSLQMTIVLFIMIFYLKILKET